MPILCYHITGSTFLIMYMGKQQFKDIGRLLSFYSLPRKWDKDTANYDPRCSFTASDKTYHSYLYQNEGNRKDGRRAFMSFYIHTCIQNSIVFSNSYNKLFEYDININI